MTDQARAEIRTAALEIACASLGIAGFAALGLLLWAFA